MEQPRQTNQLTPEESTWLACAIMQAHVNGDEEGAQAVASMSDDPAKVREAMAHAAQPANAPQGEQFERQDLQQPQAKSIPSIPRLPGKTIPPSRFQIKRRSR